MQQNNKTDDNNNANRDESVVKTTVQQQSVTDKLPTHEYNRFTSLIAKGYSPVKALRGASERFRDKSFGYVWRIARELLTAEQVQKDVATKQERLSELARLSEDRLEEILTDGRSEKVIGDVSMFLYDHANGKATQRIEMQSKSISVSIDLTGKAIDAGERAHRQAHDQ